MGYHGADRRKLDDSLPSPLGRAFLVAAGTLALTAVAVAGQRLSSSPLYLEAAAVEVFAITGTVLLACTVGGFAVARGGATGMSPPWLIGAAMLVMGVVAVGGGRLIPVLVDGPRAAHPPALATGTVVALGLLAWAVAVEEVDTRLRPRVLTALVAFATVALGLVLREVVDGPWPRDGWSVAVATAWLVLAVVHARQGRRTGSSTLAWCSIAAAGFGITATLRSFDASSPGPASVALVPLVALGLFAFGLVKDLRFDSVAHREKLRQSRFMQQEQAHEVRNALAAIEGATSTLERYRERLDPDTRAALSSGVAAEVRRMQRLFMEDTTPFELFSVADVVARAVAGLQALGVDVQIAIPERLQVEGRPAEIIQVVRNLLENARRYAPGSTVRVVGQDGSDGVLLRVEDDGPGVRPDERWVIFERGVRGNHGHRAPGEGLGLHLARRLVTAHGGAIWVEDTEAGGAAFVVRLPAPH